MFSTAVLRWVTTFVVLIDFDEVRFGSELWLDLMVRAEKVGEVMLAVGLVSKVVAPSLNDPVLLPLVNLDKPSPRLRNGLFTFAASEVAF